MTLSGSGRLDGLSLIDTEWRRWERLLERLRPEQYSLPLFESESAAETWTIRDILAHIAAWKRNIIRVAEQHLAGGAPPLDETPDGILGIDVQAFNEDIYQRWRAAPISDAIDEHRAAHRELMAILESLAPEKIPAHATRTWLYPATWHPRLHRLHVLDALDPL